jgi:hypothetical protein
MTGEVTVGYFGFVCPTGAQVHIAPRGDSKTVAQVRKGGRFAVQSTRNPAGSARPARRAAVNGYVWGYPLGGQSGWVRFDLLTPDTQDRTWADGPAGADFHVGRQKPKVGGRKKCSGRASNSVRTVKVADTYIRYAPQSTPFYYVARGDKVRERWRYSGNYMCIEVIESDVAPKGTRGWIPNSAVS